MLFLNFTFFMVDDCPRLPLRGLRLLLAYEPELRMEAPLRFSLSTLPGGRRRVITGASSGADCCYVIVTAWGIIFGVTA